MMVKIFFLFVIQGLLMLSSSSAGEKLEAISYPLPPSLAMEWDKRGVPVGVKELERIEVLGMPMRAYDMREWFTQNGLEIPKDGQAIYLRDANLLMLKASSDSLTLVRGGAEEGQEPRLWMIFTEFSLVSFNVAGSELEKALSYEQLRAAAGASWKVLNRVSCVQKSGSRAKASSQGEVWESRLGPEAKESVLEAEAVVGPDEATIDVTYAYKLRGVVEGIVGIEVTSQSQTVTMSGYSNILQISGPTRAGGPLYAVLMRSSIQLPGNVPLPPLETGVNDK